MKRLKGQRVHLVLLIALASALLPGSVVAAPLESPPSNFLLGFDPATPLPSSFTAQPFDYPSAKGVLNLPAPPDRKSSPDKYEVYEEYLGKLVEPGKYKPGSPAHFYARWKEYVAGGGKSSFEKYRAKYVQMNDNRERGWAFEPFVRDSEKDLFSGADWQFGKAVDGTGVTNKPDAYAKSEPYFYEFKSSAELRANQLAGFVTIAQKTDKTLVVVFQQLPSTGALRAIDRANKALNRVAVIARYYPAIAIDDPVPDDAHAPPRRGDWLPPGSDGTGATGGGGNPVTGPSGDAGILAAPGQHTLADDPSAAVADSPNSPADAEEDAELTQAIAAQDAREFGARYDPDVAAPQNPGGVDFSTLQLRYVSDTYHNGASVQYAFKADALPDGEQSFGGQRNAQLASDSFFTWLALNPSQFWVNLNPDEPDRIIDPQFGKTDAGRVLLEADLQMKKTVAKLIHPDTLAGQRFWDAMEGDTKCLQTRNWIVPDTATVREDGNELYILDIPLLVKTESDYLQTPGVAAGCGAQDPAITAHNQQVYKTMILPQIQEAVNHAPEYADLRRVYASRVAAEWFRRRSATKHTAYSDLIGTGDISRWQSREPWTPQEVFDQYVQSYKNGEFTITHTTTQGDTIYTNTYVFGGVDFSHVPQDSVSAATFTQGHPATAGAVANALYGPGTDGNGVWLGGLTSSAPLAEAFAKPAPATASPLLYPLITLPLAGWVAAGVWLLLRRRRRLVPSVEGSVE